jgi:hypothetical protein
MTKQIVFFAEPFHRMFFINNINIMYPHALVERVPVSWNILYAVGAPLVTLAAWLLLSKASLHKFHVTILGLLVRSVLLLQSRAPTQKLQCCIELLYNRRHQECCWTSTPRSDIKVQTSTWYTQRSACHNSCVHGN